MGCLMPDGLRVRHQDGVCFATIDRAEHRNAIDAGLIAAFSELLRRLPIETTILVIEGGPEYFCFGADFGKLGESGINPHTHRPGELYDIWHKLATGPFVSIAHVRGQVNAGGLGFVAACDMVIADDKASFSLSEILFGLEPACVLPFLIRRVGIQRAHYMTLSARKVDAKIACAWGLVDAVGPDTDTLLRQHLIGCRRLSRMAIKRHKAYMDQLLGKQLEVRDAAVEANMEAFTDPANIRSIQRFISEGVFPWEAQ